MTTTFLEHLRQRQEQKQQQHQAKEEWLSSLKRLLEQVRCWLKEAEESGLLRVRVKEIDLNEAGLGYYKAPGLVLWLGEDEEDFVLLHPQQRQIIGAEGRVDLFNRDDRYVLLKKGDTWFIHDESQPQRSKELTETSFQEILRSLWPAVD